MSILFSWHRSWVLSTHWIFNYTLCMSITISMNSLRKVTFLWECLVTQLLGYLFTGFLYLSSSVFSYFYWSFITFLQDSVRINLFKCYFISMKIDRWSNRLQFYNFTITSSFTSQCPSGYVTIIYIFDQFWKTRYRVIMKTFVCVFYNI